jgi:hypothetical protein
MRDRFDEIRAEDGYMVPESTGDELRKLLAYFKGE